MKQRPVKDKTEEFFRQMKIQEERQPVPPFEEIYSRKTRYHWWLGAAAVISVIAVFLMVDPEKEIYPESEVILDTSTSPDFTRELSRPASSDLYDWEAPTDYLSKDFN